jgi:hypothetical protein
MAEQSTAKGPRGRPAATQMKRRAGFSMDGSANTGRERRSHGRIAHAEPRCGRRRFPPGRQHFNKGFLNEEKKLVFRPSRREPDATMVPVLAAQEQTSTPSTSEQKALTILKKHEPLLRGSA